MNYRIAIWLLAPVFIGGCAANVSPSSYSVGSVGQVNRTVAGVIVSARGVTIEGTAGAGSLAGGAAGAVAGSSIGGGGRANALGAIGGAVVGSIAGAAVEQNSTRQQGIEYVVQTNNGNLMTIVQGPTPAFAVDQRVLVLYGSPARVIADPRYH
jgi:outer membrane lipoprotein SlyB